MYYKYNVPNLINAQYTNIFNNLPKWSESTCNQIINYTIHIGHSIKNTNIYCGWMVYGIRDGIQLINLFKFIYMFRAGLFTVELIIKSKSPIWFVNLDKSASILVQYPARNCGEYWVCKNWIRGMVSNYKVIWNSLRRVYRIGENAWNRKLLLLQSNFENWGFTRNTWPRALFVSNVKFSYGACHEANKLKIPCLGIIDTDSPIRMVSIAIPGNDESIASLGFYNTLISTFILYKKFAYIHSWYFSQINKNYNKKLELNENYNFFNDITTNPLKIITYGLNLIPANRIWQNRYIEDVIYPKINLNQNIKTTVKNFLFLNNKMLITIAKYLNVKLQLKSSIFKYSKYWYIKMAKNKWNKNSIYRNRNMKNIFKNKYYNYFFRKLLKKTFNKAQLNLEFDMMVNFYKIFNCLFLPTLIKNNNIFRNKFIKHKKYTIKKYYNIWRFRRLSVKTNFQLKHKADNKQINKLFISFLIKNYV